MCVLEFLMARAFATRFIKRRAGTLSYPALEERIANTDAGAITVEISKRSMFPADDFTDPAAVHTFSHLSASIRAVRAKQPAKGCFMRSNPLQSNSKMATPSIVGPKALRVASEDSSHTGQYA